MSKLDEIFAAQKACRAGNGATEDAETRRFLQFTAGGSLFAVPIGQVREVVEKGQIVPYPEARRGHVGLTNLRGEIVPVLALEGIGATEPCASRDARMIVLLVDEKEPFCILGCRPRIVPSTELNRNPVRLLASGDFAKTEGDAA